MRLTYEQENVLENLVKDIENKFSDVKFVEVTPSPESENTFWVLFTKPASDDRFIEIGEYASKQTLSILIKHGFHFVVLPDVENNAVETLTLA